MTRNTTVSVLSIALAALMTLGSFGTVQHLARVEAHAAPVMVAGTAVIAAAVAPRA